jgi:alpha-L-fucosidase 2
MDNQILREFFAACIEIQRILGVDEDYAVTLTDMIDRLPKDQVGANGQLLEWDQEYTELTPGMSHISHLFACYPGSSINWRDKPELMSAVRKSLELRVDNGAGRGGWPLAWFINVNARLLDGSKTDEGIKKMLTDSSMRSFLNARSVFQIDGNLGAAAGIAECLLQSHIALHFLPALPKTWMDGSATGLVARGGHEVDLKWQNGILVEAVVRPQFDGPIEVVAKRMCVICDGVPIPVITTGIGFFFNAEGGRVYFLFPM